MKARDECYRIELPRSSEAEEQQVEEFKQVLPTVLKYEITPCPFNRGFQVDLPEPPKEPVIVKPWRPRQASQPAVTETFIESRFLEQSPGRWALRGSEAEQGEPSDFRPDNGVEPVSINAKLANDLEVTRLDMAITSPESREPKPLESITEDGTSTENSIQGKLFKTSDRSKMLKNLRSVTAPLQVALVSNRKSEAMEQSIATDQAPIPGLASNTDSFRAFHSPISPLPPSPPYSNPPSPSPVVGDDTGLTIGRSRAHKRDPSEVTITADSAMFEPQFRTEHLTTMVDETVDDDAVPINDQQPSTPTLIPSSSPSSSSPNWPKTPSPSPRTEIRQRRISRRRSQSPLPPQISQVSPASSSSASVYSSSSARLSSSTGHHLTAIIMQKTCSLLLGPPVHLVALMMKMARRIARGAYNGLTFGYGSANSPRKQGERKRVPGSWESSLGSETDGESIDGRSIAHSTTGREPLSRATTNDDYDDAWDDEDDFGMAINRSGGDVSKARLSARERAEKMRREAAGLAGWGVD